MDVIAMPANTSPVNLGRMMQDKVKRMGMTREANVYEIMDGDVYFWGVFDDKFVDISIEH